MNHGCVLCRYFCAVQDNEAALSLVKMLVNDTTAFANHIMMPLTDAAYATASSDSSVSVAVKQTFRCIMNTRNWVDFCPVVVGTCETFLRLMFYNNAKRPPPDVVLVSFYFKFVLFFLPSFIHDNK
jgi:acetone carboxylase gamma subunit